MDLLEVKSGNNSWMAVHALIESTLLVLLTKTFDILPEIIMEYQI